MAQQTSERLMMTACQGFGRSSQSLEELAEICASVSEELLDYNPLLAVMAEALHKAVQLELESQRCRTAVFSKEAD